MFVQTTRVHVHSYSVVRSAPMGHDKCKAGIYLLAAASLGAASHRVGLMTCLCPYLHPTCMISFGVEVVKTCCAVALLTAPFVSRGVDSNSTSSGTYSKFSGCTTLPAVQMQSTTKSCVSCICSLLPLLLLPPPPPLQIRHVLERWEIR